MTKILFRKWRSLLFRIRFLRSVISDRIKGLDFTTSVSCEDAGIQNIPGVHYYASSGFAPELKATLDRLKITSGDSVLDMGSGKGGALLMLSRYPFRRIAGIELSEKLALIAKKNFERLKTDRVEVIIGDAMAFTGSDDFNHFYFFNPFGADILKEVLKNIIFSVKAKPRDVTVIYSYPKYASVFEEVGFFELSDQIIDGARKVNVYRLHPSAL